MRALVVDDSSAMRAVLSMTLKRRGFEDPAGERWAGGAHGTGGRRRRST